MEFFALVSRYLWILSILVNLVNFLAFRHKAQKYIRENPQLKAGYGKLFQGYLFWSNLPWLVMGIGCTIGGVPSIFHYFRPADGNPYVLAWYGSIFLIYIMGTFWLFFRDGAETLAQYPGMIELRYGLQRKDITNPKWIKIFWLLVLTGSLIAFVAILFASPTLPDLG